jgi:hypothetical protein
MFKACFERVRSGFLHIQTRAGTLKRGIQAAKEAPKAFAHHAGCKQCASSAGTRPARSDFDELIGCGPKL